MVHAKPQSSIATISETAYIGALCLIGEPAENRATWPETPFGVEIQDDAILCGLVTVDAGTVRNTVIGKRVMLMKHCHVGHDALIGDDCTIACGAKIGGHVELGKGCNIGLNAVIHPRVKVPPGCMIGAGAVVTKNMELKPFCCYVGNPARFLRWNQKAIEIAGLTAEQVTEIQSEWLTPIEWEIIKNIPKQSRPDIFCPNDNYFIGETVDNNFAYKEGVGKISSQCYKTVFRRLTEEIKSKMPKK